MNRKSGNNMTLGWGVRPQFFAQGWGLGTLGLSPGWGHGHFPTNNV